MGVASGAGGSAWSELWSQMTARRQTGVCACTMTRVGHVHAFMRLHHDVMHPRHCFMPGMVAAAGNGSPGCSRVDDAALGCTSLSAEADEYVQETLRREATESAQPLSTTRKIVIGR